MENNEEIKWIVIRPDGKKVVLTMEDLEYLENTIAITNDRIAEIIKRLGWDLHPWFKEDLEDYYEV